MKKMLKGVLSFVLCGMVLLFSACGGRSPNTPPVSQKEHSVWSKPSTVIVFQDEEYADSFKEPAAFKVSGGRGEYEASQIIITAGSSDISSYNIEVSDLTFGEYKIDKSYIDVYNEKYIHVNSSPASVSTGLGWYPDALLPFDVAVLYGENKVKAGNNQGIYIEVFIPRNAPAGEYKGTFTLTIDGKKTNIPASVLVYDFEVSQESHLQTDWIVNLMAFGELDNTPEMVNTYFRTVAGFRASTHSMSSGASNADEWLQTVRTYTNPNLRDDEGKPLIGEKEVYLAQINLPSSYDANTGISHSVFDTYISRLIKASIEDEYDYLSKSGCYMGFIDEPQYNNTWDKVNFVSRGYENRKEYWADIIKNGDINTIASKAGLSAEQEEALSQKFQSLSGEFKVQLEQSMRLVGNYITAYPDPNLDNTVSKQFCIGTGHIGTARYLEELANWPEGEISGNWWYAAGTSFFGNRIDSHRLEQRLSQWFTYDIGAKGYLIWEVAQYQQITWNNVARANSYEPCDAYALALRIQNSAGDGYLFYPGKPYGIFGPVSSIRAHQYRDSHEEYEYFYLLNQLYTQAGYSADAVLAKIFKTLFNNNRVVEDEKFFAQQREQIVNLILLAQKGVFVTDYSELNANANLSVVSTGEATLTEIDGEPASLKSAAISRDMTKSAKDITFKTDSDLSFTLYLGGKAKLLYSPDSAVDVRGGSSQTAQLEGANAVKFTFSVDEGVSRDLQNFDFTYEADSGSINADLNYLAVTLYNPSNERVIIECWFMGTSNRTVSVDDIVLVPGYNTFYIPRLDLVRWGTIRTLTGIRFKLIMPSDAQEFELYLTGIYAVQ